MNDLRTKQLPVFCNSDFFIMNHPASITIGHLNIHNFLEKQKDLVNEFNVLKDIDIMCFTETYLEKCHDIKNIWTDFPTVLIEWIRKMFPIGMV